MDMQIIEHLWSVTIDYFTLNNPYILYCQSSISYTYNGQNILVIKSVNRLIHNNDGPSEILETPTGMTETWYYKGYIHRDYNPAIIIYTYTKTGRKYISEKHWYKSGQRYRELSPAVIKYTADGNIWFRKWYKYNKLHRIDGPSSIVIRDGKKYYEWSNHGMIFKKITSKLSSYYDNEVYSCVHFTNLLN